MSAAGPEGVALEITESSLTFYPGLAAALPHERLLSQQVSNMFRLLEPNTLGMRERGMRGE